MIQSDKKLNLAFITNTRCNEELALISKYYLGFGKSPSGFADFYDCKKSKIEVNGLVYNSQMIIISSTVSDLYSGFTGHQNMDAKQRNEAMGKIQIGRQQVKAAVLHAINDLQVDVICFGASTKRLLKPSALKELAGNSKTIFSLGDNYTAAVSIEQIKEAASFNGIDLYNPEVNFVIVGAYGLIGQLVTNHFSNYGCRLLLVGRDINKFSSLKEIINPGCNYELYTDCSQITKRVDILFTSTNAPGSIITPEILEQWGEKIIALDVAEPPNISSKVCETAGDRLQRFDAGIVFNETLEFENGNGMGLRDKTIFACFAEGIIASVLASCGKFKLGLYDLMNVNPDYFNMLTQNAKECGFCIDQFQSFGKLIYNRAA